MKKKMLLIVTLCLLSVNAAQASRTAGCIVRIETDQQFLPLTSESVQRIIYSPAVAPAAVKEVLNIDVEYDEVVKIVKLNSERGGPFNIQINLGDDKLPPVAEELLKAVAELLKKAMDDAYADFIKQKSGNWTRLQENIERARSYWGGRNSEYADFIQNNPIPHDNIPEYIYELTEEIERDELDMNVIKRQLNELDNRRQTMERKLLVRVRDDLMAEQLNRLVEIEAVALKKLQGGRMTGLEEVEKNLLNAKIELAKRQEQLSQQVQSELSEISKQMADLSMDLPYLEIRSSSLQHKLTKARTSLGHSHQYETLELERKYAKKNLEKAMEIYQDAKLDIEMYSPPTVVAIGIK
jgi:hypothetical protein